jgi:hypothetical protein
MNASLPPETFTIDVGAWHGSQPIGEGWSIVIIEESDPVASVTDEDQEWLGRLEWSRTSDHDYTYTARPRKMNGAARIILDEGRNGALWWQPPADILASPDALRTMQAWILERWRYGYTLLGARFEHDDGTETPTVWIGGVDEPDDGLARELLGESRAEYVGQVAKRLGTVPAILEGVAA